MMLGDTLFKDWVLLHLTPGSLAFGMLHSSRSALLYRCCTEVVEGN